VEVQTE
jgi:hypothetical protein